jgi:RNA polymerase-interacting CarD/CdnL/TRCF family regulator
MKQAEEMLHGELAVALDIPVEQVQDYINQSLQMHQSAV